MEWTEKIVVANMEDDSLSVICPYYRMEVERISLGQGLGPMALYQCKEKACLLIVQSYDNSLGVFDLQKKEIVTTTYVGRRPNSIAADSSGAKIYIANGDSDSVSIVNGECFKLLGQIPVGSMPEGIDCHDVKPLMAVANSNSHSVWVIDTEEYKTLKVVKLEGYPFGVKFSRKHNRLYIGWSPSEQQKDGRISVFDLDTGEMIQEIPVGYHPQHIVESKDSSLLFVVSMGTGTLELIQTDPYNLMDVIDTGSMVSDAVLSPDERLAYVSNPEEDIVSILDWRRNRKVGEVATGKEPSGMIYLK